MGFLSKAELAELLPAEEGGVPVADPDASGVERCEQTRVSGGTSILRVVIASEAKQSPTSMRAPGGRLLRRAIALLAMTPLAKRRCG